MAFQDCIGVGKSWDVVKNCVDDKLGSTETANKTTAELELIRNKLNAAYNILQNAVTNIPTSTDLQNKLNQIGLLQIDIEDIKSELRTVEQDLDTAQTRQEVTAKPITKTSFYESISGRLGFSKPLHTISISILIAAGIFFSLSSALLLKEFVFKSAEPVSVNSDIQTGLFFTDPRFYAVVSGFTFVGVLIAGLAYFGYLGEQ